MNSKITIILSMLIALTSFVSACNDGCLNMREKEVKKMLNSKLSIGDDRGKVELIIDNIGIEFSYDKYEDQYYTTIRDEHCGPYQGISVYISFDESEKLSEINISKFYTMP